MSEQPLPPVTPDVVMFGIIWLLIIGAMLFSGWLWLLGRFTQTTPAPADVSSVSVNPLPPPPTNRQTDSQTNPVFAPHIDISRLRVDRTREAIIYTLVELGWGTGEIRNVVKGDATWIGALVAQAKIDLGMEEPPETMTVRDYAGVREIIK